MSSQRVRKGLTRVQDIESIAQFCRQGRRGPGHRNSVHQNVRWPGDVPQHSVNIDIRLRLPGRKRQGVRRVAVWLGRHPPDEKAAGVGPPRSEADCKGGGHYRARVPQLEGEGVLCHGAERSHPPGAVQLLTGFEDAGPDENRGPRERRGGPKRNGVPHEAPGGLADPPDRTEVLAGGGPPPQDVQAADAETRTAVRSASRGAVEAGDGGGGEGGVVEGAAVRAGELPPVEGNNPGGFGAEGRARAGGAVGALDPRDGGERVDDHGDAYGGGAHLEAGKKVEISGQCWIVDFGWKGNVEKL